MDVREWTVSSAAVLDAAPNLLEAARERELTARELMHLRVSMGQLRVQANRFLPDNVPSPWCSLQGFDRKTALGYGRDIGKRIGCYYLLRPSGQGRTEFVEVECKISLRGSMGLLIPYPRRQRTLWSAGLVSRSHEVLVTLALMRFRPTMELVTLDGLDVRTRAFRVIREFVGSDR